MNFLALTLAYFKHRELQILEALFMVYVLLSFLRVAGYVATQFRLGQLIHSENPPVPFVIPDVGGWLLFLGVMILLYLQQPLYMVLVVMGIVLLMTLNGRTAVEQFGLGRMPVSRAIAWSVLVCGAVIFIEVPLSTVVEKILNAIHMPHPEQQSVEIFKQLNQPREIFGFMIQAVLISPLIEELFFRGFLLTFLKKYTSTLVAILLSAGVFALAHANLDSAIPLWFLGIVLGIAYQHTGSLLLPIGIHGCFNLISGLNLLLEKGNG